MRQVTSLAGRPKELIENPDWLGTNASPQEDVLSDVLRTIRLSGSVQFCFMSSGSWRTGNGPASIPMAVAASAIPFHVVLDGGCWLKAEGQEYVLAAGDVIAFPFGADHQVGCGSGGRVVDPFADLPPPPVRTLPILRYGNGVPQTRILCGFLQCDAMKFRPLRTALPSILFVRTKGSAGADWLRSTIARMAAEVDRPRGGALSMLERLAEIMFIELLRHHIMTASSGSIGWLAALADPQLGRCLALVHENPGHDWSVRALAAGCGLSRSTLAERFEAVLGTSPMRYLRDWRLCLASIELATTGKAIAVIAHEAGYGTEAAFNRAFSRAYGTPPATWRQGARSGAANPAQQLTA